MVFRVEKIEVDTKGVIKALILTGVGIGVYRAICKPQMYVTCVEVKNKKTDKNKSDKKKVESK